MPLLPGSGDIVETAASAAGLTKPPLLVLDRVRVFLDEHRLGAGEVRAQRIGEGGGSNFTFLLERDEGRFVLRRPPRPPLPPSAHDVVREARLQLALRQAGFDRLPTIVAVGEDESILGVPFYVMTYLEGHVPTDVLPPASKTRPTAAAWATTSWTRSSRSTPPTSRLPRSPPSPGRGATTSARFAGSRSCGRSTRRASSRRWTRSGRGSPRTCLRRCPEAVVHGDFRLGNTMVAPDEPSRILAVLDWEMGAVGDPRADVGYLLATYSEPGGPPSPLGTSPVTALPGFPTRSELVERYVARSGRDVEPLNWFVALALWKAAVFCEAIYGRFVRGELGAEDERAARFEQGVP